MIRRLALTAGFAILGAVAFAPNANAQAVEETVDFSGNFGSTCTFSNTAPGTLEKDTPLTTWIQAGDGTDISPVGQAGTTTVNCTGGGSLTVKAPDENGVPNGFAGQPTYAVVYDGTNYTAAGTPANTAWTQPTAALTIPVGTDLPLNVGMTAGTENSGNDVPPGTYSYQVTLTATPN